MAAVLIVLVVQEGDRLHHDVRGRGLRGLGIRRSGLALIQSRDGYHVGYSGLVL